MKFPLQPPFDNTHLLNAAGACGAFGGDEVVSAMATVHVYQNRKWFGWYNTPGSYEIAKRYGRLAKSRFFDGLFPGVHTDPATLFELDGTLGPTFLAAHSGIIIGETGRLAALLSEHCSTLPHAPLGDTKTEPISVTIFELHHTPEARMSPPPQRTLAPRLAMVPTLTSFATCATCALCEDWWSFSMILLGILTSGISCLVIGSGQLIFMHPTSAPGSPPGDGILVSDREFVLLKGSKGAVNSVTQGRFSLHFDSEPHYRNIGWCSVLLMFQFTAQLVLIPEGRLFGQLMFVVSLAVSWMYNLWLSSFDKQRVQLEMLMNVLHRPRSTKYALGTRMSMVVFVLLILAPEDPRKLMDLFLPNDTKALTVWKDAVTSHLREAKPLLFNECGYDDGTFSKDEMTQLEVFFGDAASGYHSFTSYQRQNQSKVRCDDV